jgi:hypothetical protein
MGRFRRRLRYADAQLTVQRQTGAAGGDRELRSIITSKGLCGLSGDRTKRPVLQAHVLNETCILATGTPRLEKQHLKNRSNDCGASGRAHWGMLIAP